MLAGKLGGNEAQVWRNEDTQFLMMSPITGNKMICEWIIEAAKRTKVAACRLEKQEVSCIIKEIRDRYTKMGEKSDYLWEEFVDDISKYNPDGWQISCEYPIEQPILFFCDGKSYEGFRFETNYSIHPILSDTPCFEFFITNDAVDFVLCFNHHDYLIGVGNCKDWLSNIPDFSN